MRVLKWVVDRVHGRAFGVESPIGWVPKYEDLDWSGIDFPREKFNEVMEIDREMWKKEISSHDELFSKLYDRLPKEFTYIKELITSSLWRSPEKWAMAPERND